jgi:hypothetical protein
MYSEVILTSHFWIKRDELRNVEKAKAMFTAVPKYSETPVHLYKEHNEWFGVPLYHFPKHDGIAKKLTDNRVRGRAVNFNFTSQLWEGQDELLSQFKKLVVEGQTGFVVQAPPGFGKTVVVIRMLSMLGRTALVVVPRSNLLQQWIKRLTDHTDIKRSEIGEASDGKVNWAGKKVVVGLVHTVGMDRFGAAFRDYFGVVAFDEVDRSVPPQTFAPVAAMFSSKYRIGVSATMKRQDAMEVVFQKHIGQNFLKGKDANRMKPKVLIHYYDKSSGPIFGRSTLNKRGMLLSRLGKNKERNTLIAQYVRSIYVSGRRVCVLSDRTQQLASIRSILLDNGWVKDDEVGFYVRRLPLLKKDMKAGELKHVAAVCKVILATYGMFAIGTDIQDLAGLIYATPMSETEQSKGRIERLLAGKLQPVVVDLVDTSYKMSLGWGRKREGQYSSEGLKIKKVRSEKWLGTIKNGTKKTERNY